MLNFRAGVKTWLLTCAVLSKMGCLSKFYIVSNKIALVFILFIDKASLKKSRIRETPTLLTDGDSRADTNLKRLRDI